MTPEDWKTYWRTVALTPFQILDMEKREALVRKVESMKIPRANVRAAYLGDVLVWVDDETVMEAVDSMELQMMGIKP